MNDNKDNNDNHDTDGSNRHGEGDANYFPYTVGNNIKVGSNTLTVGSDTILMVGSNEVRGRYIVRKQKLTVKPYVREANWFSIALPMLAQVRKLDLATDRTKWSTQLPKYLLSLYN